MFASTKLFVPTDLQEKNDTESRRMLGWKKKNINTPMNLTSRRVIDRILYFAQRSNATPDVKQ